jgi:glycerol uptake facilitator-like aquaporin
VPWFLLPPPNFDERLVLCDLGRLLGHAVHARIPDRRAAPTTNQATNSADGRRDAVSATATARQGARHRVTLARRALAEFVGTAFLVMAVIGSGIAASHLSPGQVGLELLENAAATAGALVAIILAVGPVSGAHINPVVTLVDLAFGGMSGQSAAAYIVAQVTGGALGAVLANVMYSLPAVELSKHARTGGALWLSEVVATFGLLLVVFGVARSGRASAAPFAVGAYIGAAYFFTSSTSFANPAVTTARMLSNTFAGIAPGSVLAFIMFQLLGGLVGFGAIRLLYPEAAEVAQRVVVPHQK